MAADESETGYAIEQSEAEMRRLALQADVLETQPTRWLFEQAGLTAGMRVLDVGCGAGDVAFLAAEMVGPSGAVVGVDNSPRALESARIRAERLGLTNVSFIEGDLRNPEFTGEFDALVGRLVLIHVAGDRAATLRGLLRFVRPGGLVAFREHLIGEPPFEAIPRCELLEQFGTSYMRDMVSKYASMGVDGQVGLRLHQIFQEAGLPAPQMWLTSSLGSEADWAGWEYLSQQVQMIMSFAGSAGIEPLVDLNAGTFAERVRRDVLTQHGVLRLQRAVLAWARKSSGGL